MVIAGLQRTHGSIGDLRDLFVRHIVEVFHVENKALLVGELQEGLLKLELDLITRDMRGAIEPGGELVGYITDGQKETPLLSLQKAQAFVRRDTVDPCVQLGIFAEAGDVLMDLDEDFLRDVIGIVVVDDHLADMPVNTLLIRAHEQVKPVVQGLRISDLF